MDQGKVVSMEEGSGECVDATLVSNTGTHSRTFSLTDLTRDWGLFNFVVISDNQWNVCMCNESINYTVRTVVRLYMNLRGQSGGSLICC